MTPLYNTSQSTNKEKNISLPSTKHEGLNVILEENIHIFYLQGLGRMTANDGSLINHPSLMGIRSL